MQQLDSHLAAEAFAIYAARFRTAVARSAIQQLIAAQFPGCTPDPATSSIWSITLPSLDQPAPSQELLTVSQQAPANAAASAQRTLDLGDCVVEYRGKPGYAGTAAAEEILDPSRLATIPRSWCQVAARAHAGMLHAKGLTHL